MMGLITIIVMLAIIGLVALALPAYIIGIFWIGVQFCIVWIIINSICKICFKLSLMALIYKAIKGSDDF